MAKKITDDLLARLRQDGANHGIRIDISDQTVFALLARCIADEMVREREETIAWVIENRAPK